MSDFTFNEAEKVCAAFEKRLENAFKPLTIKAVVYLEGDKIEALKRYNSQIQNHPAYAPAQYIIAKEVERPDFSENSSFLGLAAKRNAKITNMFTKDHLLGIIGINVSEYKTLTCLENHLAQLSWEAINITKLRRSPKYSQKFMDGPLIPLRTTLNRTKANLRADIFMVALRFLDGDKSAVLSLAQRRSLDILLARIYHRPEEYPYPVIFETLHRAIQEGTLTPSKRSNDNMKQAWDLADMIGGMVSDEQIKEWWTYAKPAQDMAWRGYRSDLILGASFSTNRNARFKTIGLLIQDLSKLQPYWPKDDSHLYNPFESDEGMMHRHNTIIDEIFEDVVAKGMYENSGDPFLQTANALNGFLREGNVLGWCGAALQSAAGAFDRAILSGRSPSSAARMEFEGQRNKTSWEALQALGEKISDRKRDGVIVTHSEIVDLCAESDDLNTVRLSVNTSIKDGRFQEMLKNADYTTGLSPAVARTLQMNMNGPNIGPNTPAPAPQGPAPVVVRGPAGPSLGMGGSGIMPASSSLSLPKAPQELVLDEDDE